MHAMLERLVVSGSRLYAGATMERHEVAVATRADPALRGEADATAAEIARRWNAEPALRATVARLRGALERLVAGCGEGPDADEDDYGDALDAARSALSETGGE